MIKHFLLREQDYQSTNLWEFLTTTKTSSFDKLRFYLLNIRKTVNLAFRDIEPARRGPARI
jgi:hypothetical protein